MNTPTLPCSYSNVNWWVMILFLEMFLKRPFSEYLKLGSMPSRLMAASSGFLFLQQ